jgi:hypothetical protein
MPYGLKTERNGSPLAALAEMADQIVSHGVHSITGDIVGDDTWFVYERYGAGWSWDDLQWGYGAPISALSINDNEVYLNAMPATQAGAMALASFPPAIPPSRDWSGHQARSPFGSLGALPLASQGCTPPWRSKTRQTMRHDRCASYCWPEGCR